MTHEERERLIRLQAAAMHDVEPTPGIEIVHSRHTENGFTVDVLKAKNINNEDIRIDIEPDGTCAWFRDRYGSTGDTIYDDDIDVWIALLLRARQIMGGA